MTIAESLGNDFVCPHCTRKMNWLAADGQSTVVSLQHYRDGTIGLICRACNTRHAAMADDSFRDVPVNSKHCPQCKRVLPLDSFATDNSGRWANRKTYCRECSHEFWCRWKERKSSLGAATN
jgi:hypothetical protein